MLVPVFIIVYPMNSLALRPLTLQTPMHELNNTQLMGPTAFSQTECLYHGKLQEHVVCIEIFNCLGTWDPQLMTAKRSLALEAMSLSAQNCRMLLRCYAGHPENKSFLKMMSKGFNILQI